MLVVKLGGSLYGTPELRKWLTILATYAKKTNTVIVPGGGPFADQVRQAQSQHHFSDKTAHHMALIAMKQFGLLLADLAPACSVLQLDKPIRSPLSVWLPDESVLAEPELAHDWTISADSIALWLASRLNAKQLLLIKRTHINSSSIKALSSDTILDSAFATLFANSPVDTKIIHYQADFDSVNLQASLVLP